MRTTTPLKSVGWLGSDAGRPVINEAERVAAQARRNMKLTYTPKRGMACPGDGWPAADHEEPDTKLAKAKVASGFYVREKQDTEPQQKEARG